MGLPAPGIELKLAPVGGKIEARVQGPNITPGYWRDEALTRGRLRRRGVLPARRRDAVRRSGRIRGKGLLFDGRLAEDFKLSTGTWVSVGPLRARILAAGGRLRAGRRDRRSRSRVRRRADLSEPGTCRALAGLVADARPAQSWRIRACARAFHSVLDALAATEHGQLHVRRARDRARRAALARRPRDHRQGLAESEGGAGSIAPRWSTSCTPAPVRRALCRESYERPASPGHAYAHPEERLRHA